MQLLQRRQYGMHTRAGGAAASAVSSRETRLCPLIISRCYSHRSIPAPSTPTPTTAAAAERGRRGRGGGEAGAGTGTGTPLTTPTTIPTARHCPSRHHSYGVIVGGYGEGAHGCALPLIQAQQHGGGAGARGAPRVHVPRRWKDDAHRVEDVRRE